MNTPFDRLGEAIMKRNPDSVMIDLYNKSADQIDNLEEYASELELQQFALMERKARIIRIINRSNRLIESVGRQLNG